MDALPELPVQPPGQLPGLGPHSGEFLHEFLLAAARKSPDRPAVVESAGAGETTVTSYRELSEQTRSFAEEIHGLGLDIGDRVILESDTTAASIALFLACSSLGLTFVPVSPETPDERLLAIAETTEAALHIRAAEKPREGIPHNVGTACFRWGGMAVDRRPAPRVRRRREKAVTDPAYIIFTSGTTGRPKGVVMSHRAVTAFYRGMLAHRIATPEDRVASTSPLQFDFSLLNIGLALGSGAALVPVPQALVRWPRRFLGVLRDTGATQVNGVPSIWRQALRREPERLAALEGLRGVLFCGEDFPLPELRRLRELLPGIRIVNCYGATESMACSFEEVPDPLPEGTERLSIGFAHAGAEMLLIDTEGNIVDDPYVTGEIVLRSPALFSGYWADPEATDAALIPDPLNLCSGQRVLRTGDLAHKGEGGEMYFCGRKDSQVQIRGNRVELPEIEGRLLDHPDVTAAAVLLLGSADPNGTEPALTAFVVPAPQSPAPPDAAALRTHCATALPAYMVPQDIHLLDALPTTPNGKTDRPALAAAIREAAGPGR
ncbi:AMP-binding protein [Streptomyces pathocidini]|uniref:AMP-binding protein n=1 Tax=Streptomyces pathocidini TaxID=1650571 RepID=UPI0033F2D4A8